MEMHEGRPPRVSVILPVYNGESHLRQAVESILSQTWKDLECLVVDDGSTDSTPRILEELAEQDPRVRVFSSPQCGIAAALNLAIARARGEYLARQDADDWSLPQRLERQVEWLDRHPGFALVGSRYRLAEDGECPRLPTDPWRVRRCLGRGNCLCHGSVMMRRSALEQAGGYREDTVPAEDYDLWLRMSERWRLTILPEVLQCARRSSHGPDYQDSQRRQAARAQEAHRRRLRSGRAAARWWWLWASDLVRWGWKGIPIRWQQSSPRPKTSGSVDKVLAIAAGENQLIAQAIEEIRTATKAAELHLLTTPAKAQALGQLPGVSRVFTAPRVGQYSFGLRPGLVLALRQQGYSEAVVIAPASRRALLLAVASRAPRLLRWLGPGELRPAARTEMLASPAAGSLWGAARRMWRRGVHRTAWVNEKPCLLDRRHLAYLLRPARPVSPSQSFESVSLTMPVHGQAEVVSKCLRSLERHTPGPLELILVDDASTEPVRVLLEDFAQSRQWVRLVRSQTNLGFTHACNQGLRLAGGKYCLLLNSDLIFTEGWLARLLRHFQRDPGVGLAGPVSNWANQPQRVCPVAYDDDPQTEDGPDLQAFAAALARRQQGRWEETDRVIGFCLAIKREVLQRIGGLDPEVGVCSDDDYCLRARLAGFRIVIAHDVFIHHFGNISYRSAPGGYDGLMASGWEQFRRKWGIPPGRKCGEYSFRELSRTRFGPDRCFVPLAEPEVRDGARAEAAG